MDGTIVDSAHYHKLSWQETFTKRGIEFTEDDFIFAFGRRNEEIIRRLKGTDTSLEEIDVISEEKEEAFRRLISKNISALPGVTELLEALSNTGFRLAIVSSTPIKNIQLVTKTLDIMKYFDLLISGEDVTEGKPSPQGFLLAAEKLGIHPQSCVVIEDAVAGVQAAKNGGMHCIAVSNTVDREDLSEADIVVDSLEEVDIKIIMNLFS